MIQLSNKKVYGLLKTRMDAHTMGLTTISNLLQDCGFECKIAPVDVCEAVEHIHSENSFSKISNWIRENRINRLGFSYRLDPVDAKEYLCRIMSQLKIHRIFREDGGTVDDVFFAGLPDACRMITAEFGNKVVVFQGDESPVQSLYKLNIPDCVIPKELSSSNEYDDLRWNFAKNLISSERWKFVDIPDHLNYREAGTNNDSCVKRLEYSRNKGSLPLIRAHVGPYDSNRENAIKEFISWTKDLASSRLLDILSIGSSQLTQSNFGEDWDGLSNGGGVPVNSEIEYMMIKEAASPMLVRTYAGSKNVPWMAAMHERTLNIAWHALSLWWFSELDGRGPNTLLENLKEHYETIKYIAASGKPFEPNVPHHFAFRGSDDISYIISGFLSAKFAKRSGIRHLILQNMLNTPKSTQGIQDLAKGRVLLKLVRELEDDEFSVYLQTRAGLDYFSPDLEKAKIQLASVTAMMDDIEPDNSCSPEIIHVVSYSEAVRLATPPIIEESIKITLRSLEEYRKAKKNGTVPDMAKDSDLNERCEELEEEVRESIKLLEDNIDNLYTPEGLYAVFVNGFLPTPALFDQGGKFSQATKWKTAIKKGGIRVIDDNGKIIYTPDRYRGILIKMNIG